MDVPALAPARQIDERTLRHPGEWITYGLFVVLNVAILAGAVWLMSLHPPWLEHHAWVEKEVSTLRTLAIGGAIAAPWIVLFRNSRWAAAHRNSIELSEHQIPEIYAILLHHCAVLGMSEMPALYLSDKETHIARAYSAWGNKTYIVLNDKLLQPDIGQITDVLGFHIGRELGRLRLRHGTWWDELLLAYVVRIPILRNPLMHLRTYSADRYGAFLQPDGVRGLLALATGRLMLPRVDLSAYLHRLPQPRGLEALAAGWKQDEPPIAHRVRILYDLGLFTPPEPPSPGSRSH